MTSFLEIPKTTANVKGSGKNYEREEKTKKYRKNNNIIVIWYLLQIHEFKTIFIITRAIYNINM